MGKFKYLTYDDRKIIEKMYKSGMSTPKIANALGKNYSTVYRELHRCPKDYTADKAQADVDSKKKDKYDITITPKGKHFTYSDRVELEQMIKAGKSIPEMAAYFEKCTRSITREMDRRLFCGRSTERYTKSEGETKNGSQNCSGNPDRKKRERI